jgi:HlyD family secretion protein
MNARLPHRPQARRGSLRTWLLLATGILGLGGGGWWLYRSHAAPPVKYDCGEVARLDVTAKVTATGTLQAITKVTVGSQVSGKIERLMVDFNSRVKKNQVLAQIDPSLCQAALDQAVAQLTSATASFNQAKASEGNAAAAIKDAEAAIASAQAKVETSRATLFTAKAALEGAQATLASATASEANALRTFKRYQALLAKDLVAKSDLDTNELAWMVAKSATRSQHAAVESATASVRSAEAGIRAAQSDLESARIKHASALETLKGAQAAVKAAQAQISQAQASVNTAKTNLSYTIIRSPIDGVVLNRNINIGQTVQASYQAPELFTLAQNLKAMQVETACDEADVGRVREHAKATFSVDAFPNEQFDGEVVSVRKNPVTVQNVTTYTVIVTCINRSLKLMPGMTATVNITETCHEHVLTVPNASLRYKPDESDMAALPEGKEQEPAKGSASKVGEPSSARGDKGEPQGERHHGRRERRGQGGGDWPRGIGSGGGESGRGSEASSEHRRRLGRRGSVWTESKTLPGKLEEHRLKLGITDGTVTEVLRSDLHEGEKVVTGKASSEKKPTPAPGGKGPRMF